MTAGANTSTLAALGFRKGPAAFVAMGWTTQQWADLHDVLRASTDAGAAELAAWLCHPYCTFQTQISPATVLDVFTRHGGHAVLLLPAMAEGPSERFTMAFHHQQWRFGDYHASVVTGWRYATGLGLAELQATGWAETGYLHSLRDRACMDDGKPTLADADRTALIGTWIRRFGQGAWLWVLAGFTLEEATDLQKTGEAIDEQQLRVMAALNGHTLPPVI